MLTRAILSREHAELDALAVRLIDLVRRADAPSPDLSALRWQLNRKLAAHLVKEDRLLYPALEGGGDRLAADIARRFAVEMGGLAEAWRDYMSDWTIARIEADWLGFRARSEAIMTALRRRIEREEAELYPRIPHED